MDYKRYNFLWNKTYPCFLAPSVFIQYHFGAIYYTTKKSCPSLYNVYTTNIGQEFLNIRHVEYICSRIRTRGKIWGNYEFFREGMEENKLCKWKIYEGKEIDRTIVQGITHKISWVRCTDWRTMCRRSLWTPSPPTSPGWTSSTSSQV